MISTLFYGDVLIDILATCEGIEEDVAQHGYDEPIAAHISYAACQGVLNEGHDAAANNHHHKDAAGLLGVLAKSLDAKVEDATPHQRGAKAAKDEEERTDGHLEHLESVGNAITRH